MNPFFLKEGGLKEEKAPTVIGFVILGWNWLLTHVVHVVVTGVFGFLERVPSPRFLVSAYLHIRFAK